MMTKLQLLVPMDGTGFSRKIEPQIRKLFASDRWALRLLHVARAPIDPAVAAYQPAAVGPDYRLYMYGYDFPNANLHPVYDEDELEEFRQKLEVDLQDEVGLFERHGYEVSATVHFGEPAEAIAAFAEEVGVDLVAMATHDRKGWDKLIHGSVARRVLNRLAIPTLLIRAEEDDDTGENAGNQARNERQRAGTSSPANEERPLRQAEGEERTSLRASEEARPAAGGDDRGSPAGHARAVRKDDGVVTPAETQPATLAGLQGRGVVTVARADDGHVISAEGSWFPEGSDTDVQSLSEAQGQGRPVVYEGLSLEAETAGHDEHHGVRVRREARIVSVRRYQDYGGQTKTLVSFELVDPDNVSDIPEQYSHSEFERLDLRTISEITGLQPPPSTGTEQEAEYREKAWRSYKLDLEHRDEWGTARQNTSLPRGE